MDYLPFYSLAPQHDLIRSELNNCFRKLMDRGNFILGDEVAGLEAEWATFTGVKHCIGVANGSDAITLSLRALGIGAGDEVMVPALTCSPTWMAVAAAGAKLIPVDVEMSSGLIRPDLVEAQLTSRVKAIVPVHLYGQSVDMQPLIELSNRFAVPLIEDNAQGHGARCGERMTGSMGLLGATSFYPTKNLGALGDGGAITTQDDQLAITLRQMRNYGSSIRFHHEIKGVNSRLDEWQAAVLRIKLKYLEGWNAARKLVACQYLEELVNAGDIQWQGGANQSGANHHLVVIRTQHRDALKAWLHQHDIGTDVHYPLPPHLQRSFSDYGFRPGQFPAAEEWASTVLSLPAWPGLTSLQVSRVCDAIRSFYHKR
ncbi:MAG TPA: DegT/DnrJ/EryC1/StrS family aminotransferase [Cyclobacteriaceae bacterium]|nr:DegT/DnrJ/EryC1/StrS family aminotransferase [Cyclobacteriaceae bacterium]